MQFAGKGVPRIIMASDNEANAQASVPVRDATKRSACGFSLTFAPLVGSCLQACPVMKSNQAQGREKGEE